MEVRVFGFEGEAIFVFAAIFFAEVMRPSFSVTVSLMTPTYIHIFCKLVSLRMFCSVLQTHGGVWHACLVFIDFLKYFTSAVLGLYLRLQSS